MYEDVSTTGRHTNATYQYYWPGLNIFFFTENENDFYISHILNGFCARILTNIRVAVNSALLSEVAHFFQKQFDRYGPTVAINISTVSPSYCHCRNAPGEW